MRFANRCLSSLSPFSFHNTSDGFLCLPFSSLCNCCGLRLKRFLEAAKRGRTANNCPTVIPFVAALKQTLNDTNIPAHELAKARSVIAIFEEMINESSRQAFPLKGEQAVFGCTGRTSAVGCAAFPVPAIGDAGPYQRSPNPERLGDDSANAEPSRSVACTNFFAQDPYYGEMSQFSPYTSLQSLQQDQEQMTKQIQKGVGCEDREGDGDATRQSIPGLDSPADGSNGRRADLPHPGVSAVPQDDASFTEGTMAQRLAYAGASPFMFTHSADSPLFGSPSKEQPSCYDNPCYPEYSESFL